MRRRHILDEARIWRKKKTLTVARGAERSGGAEETEETESRSEGASQLAHTSPLERPREGKRGPGTGNLLLYTRPEIRMYHSRTHVGARARAHQRPVVGLIHTGPIMKTTMESLYVRRKSIYDQRATACLFYRRTFCKPNDFNDRSSSQRDVRPRARKIRVVDCDELYDGA